MSDEPSQRPAIELTSADRLLTARQVATAHSISVRTLDRWLSDAGLAFPRPVTIKKRRYFRAAQVARWLAARIAWGAEIS